MSRSDIDPELMERIVREVIRRLEEHGVVVNEDAASPAELSLKDNVVSMAAVAGRLSGVTRLVVTRKAVVTPAVKDELRDKNVELVRSP